MSWCGRIEQRKQEADAQLYGLAFQVAAKLDAAEKRIRELEEREVHWQAYRKLLDDELDGLVGLCYSHSWRSTEEKIQKGKELRALLDLDENGENK